MSAHARREPVIFRSGNFRSEREPLIFRSGNFAYQSYDSNYSVNQFNRENALSSESSPSPNILAEVKVYKRRWYILLLFCLINFLQNIIWNTWPPITFSANPAFEWSDSMISMLSLWGNLTYVLTGFFFSWIMDFKGLRWASVLTIALITAGAAFRCITSEPKPATWLINIGQILGGLAGPVAMAGSPLLSAVWFPANERTTSTSICSLFGSLGMAGSFIIGPLMVKDRNITSSDSLQTGHLHLNHSNRDSDIYETRKEIMRLMYVELGACLVVFLLVLAYFPAKPERPPSISANVQRMDFRPGFSDIIRHDSKDEAVDSQFKNEAGRFVIRFFENSRFWLIGIAYASVVGICDIWCTFLNFYEDGVLSQIESGWLGFLGSITSGISGCLFARFADTYQRHMKSFLLVVFTISLAAMTVFTIDGLKLMSVSILASKAIAYTTYITIITGVEGCPPLFYELGCETAYPVAEGLSNGLLTWLNNVVGLVFLIVLMIPESIIGKDYKWMNWVMLGGLICAIPLLLFYKEGYRRLDVDTQPTPQIDTPTPNEDMVPRPPPPESDPMHFSDSSEILSSTNKNS